MDKNDAKEILNCQNRICSPIFLKSRETSQKVMNGVFDLHFKLLQGTFFSSFSLRKLSLIKTEAHTKIDFC